MNAIHLVIEDGRESGPFGKSGCVVVAYAPAQTTHGFGYSEVASGFVRMEMRADGSFHTDGGAVFDSDQAAEEFARIDAKNTAGDPNLFLLRNAASVWVGRSGRTFDPPSHRYVSWPSQYGH